MLTKDDFASLLRSGVLILDGALATELETRGHDLNHRLWSAKLLEDDPGSIGKVHLNYYLAGANVAITASYQSATQGLTEHLGLSEDEGKELIKLSVKLAQDAREAAYHSGVDANRKLLVAGSVGPYGAFLADGSEYRGDYTRSPTQFQDFHGPRIRALIDAGVDILALETMPSFHEIRALLDLLGKDFPTAIAWISCTTRDAQHLSDGHSWQQVLDLLQTHPAKHQIVAVGINCVPFQSVIETLEHISRMTDLPLVCYPNSGETWDAETKKWGALEPGQNDKLILGHAVDTFSGGVAAWIAAGAELVGGCCRSSPSFIRHLRDLWPR